MDEIAKCPLCGNIGDIFYLNDANNVTVFHCGMYANSIKLWNRYAAAMELAMLEYKFEFCKSEDEHKYQELIALARKQVVWAFK